MAKEDNNLVVIDADSLIYIVGSRFQDFTVEPLGIKALDEFILSILIATRCGSYIGYFGKIGGRNFRYDVAKTKPYKGNRKKEKEEWFVFWEPILKNHMKMVWGFQEVDKVEADDAVIIAANKYRSKYNKVIIASPDKDLKQFPGLHYDYRLHLELDISESTAKRQLIKQLIMGDGTDNIPGLPQGGKVLANKIADEYDGEEDHFEYVKNIYIKHLRVTLRDKMAAKQEKEYLANYRKEHNIKSLRKDAKSKALESFVVDESSVPTEKEVIELFEEQKALLTMLTTEEEGKKHGFETVEPQIYDEIDWEAISSYMDELKQLPDTQSFNFLDDI